MGKDFKDLFANGEIVGAIGTLPEPVDGVQPLIGDPKAAGFASYHNSGVYPCNHGIVVRDELAGAVSRPRRRPLQRVEVLKGRLPVLHQPRR